MYDVLKNPLEYKSIEKEEDEIDNKKWFGYILFKILWLLIFLIICYFYMNLVYLLNITIKFADITNTINERLSIIWLYL